MNYSLKTWGLVPVFYMMISQFLSIIVEKTVLKKGKRKDE
jgi:hypothetical protein